MFVITSYGLYDLDESGIFKPCIETTLHQNTNVGTHESLNCYEIIIVLYYISECVLRLT